MDMLIGNLLWLALCLGIGVLIGVPIALIWTGIDLLVEHIKDKRDGV